LLIMSATLFALVARFRMRAVKLCERGVKDPLGRLVLPVSGAEIAIEMSYRLGSRAAPAPYALPAGFAMFLAVGTAAAALHGRLTATGVLIACAAVAFAVSFTAEPVASVLLAGIGWLTVIGFSRPPYAQLRPAGPAAVHAAVVVAATALAGAGLGLVFRWFGRRLTLVSMGRTTGMRRGASDEGQPEAASDAAIGVRRRLAGVLMGLVLLPLITAVLAPLRGHLNLADDLLVYLVAVVMITVVGGFWPAVLAAVAASVLLNWYFTVPIHTFTIAQPRELLALLLFVTVAVAVSSVVHLAARRAVQAARAREEAAALLELAQTVLGGADSPAAVLEHLTRTHGGQAELTERVAGRWVRAASSGVDGSLPAAQRIDIRSDLTLMVTGQDRSATPALLAGYAAQAAAALDRERLRTQAAQAEALAEGNRMRTALLAAVSHDLRTPLASIKASVSSLRQTDVEWSEADEADLLATIEQNADRLDALIGNLLDMSRLHTGSLQPFLRPTAIDEVAPVAAGGLDDSLRLEMAVPDGFPLVLADPGLLERVLANLFSNALRYSPAGRPPELHAVLDGGTVRLEVVDHGPGVPDEQKELIFEPFERVGDRHPGVGLGLAVARGFAEAMGGRIGAFDTPGGGLTVRVTLPAASEDRSAPRASGPRASGPRGSGPRGSGQSVPRSSRSPGS
jgi:two-component system sensor histidine kinase KdpD